MREYFTEADYQMMVHARKAIHDIVLPVANTIESNVHSFDGFALFQQDDYHPDSAGAIVQINAAKTPPANLAFQREHITNHRVDLTVSTLGETFQNYKYQLAESRMNPEQHLVAGLYLPEQAGRRAASVLQLAFTKKLGAPTSEDLRQIQHYWESVAPDVVPRLNDLHRYAERFPNRSVSDALRLDVPTTPNAFIVNWDTSNSREQAREDYGKLRSDLTLRGQQFLDIATSHGGAYMRPSGDGQSFALEIPTHGYNRLSRDSIRSFAQAALYPMLAELISAAKNGDITSPVRFAVELGRIEPTTFDLSSPALFELASVSDDQPHDRLTIGFGRHAINALELDDTALQAFNA